jgi:hypothetical protein
MDHHEFGSKLFIGMSVGFANFGVDGETRASSCWHPIAIYADKTRRKELRPIPETWLAAIWVIKECCKLLYEQVERSRAL